MRAKAPCVHYGVCDDYLGANDGKCSGANDWCKRYTPSLLPVLKRWRVICLERADRIKKTKLSDAAVYVGKCEAIRKIIAHMEREK